MYEKLFCLKGKKSLVTGGSIGVGRACATALALAGADVAIVGRRREPAERTCGLLKDLGVDAFFIECDVADDNQIVEMRDKVVERFGRIDIAVNNAGGAKPGGAIEFSALDWRRTIDVNLSGVFFCAQTEAQQMQRQAPKGGKIINIASIYATVAGGNCAYNSSKAGVVQLTRSLAVEWGPEEINVNCISPGWILTPGHYGVDDGLRHRMRELTPLGNIMRYCDIYGAVIFLASAASDFMSGQELIIDGGHSVNSWLFPIKRKTPPRITADEEDAELKYDLKSISSK